MNDTTKNNIVNMNLVNYQAIESEFSNNNTICTNGTGDQCQQYLGYDNETGWLIFPTSTYNNVQQTVTMADQCGSQVPLQGTFDSTTTVDVATGQTTSYATMSTNKLHWGQLSPEGIHPFPTIKLLQKTLGEDMIIPLSSVTDGFAVNSTAFVNTTYPQITNEAGEPIWVWQNETV